MAAAARRWNGGYADDRRRPVTLRYNGTVVLDHGAPTDVEPDVSGPSCTIDLDSGSATGKRRLPDERPLLRLRPHQRGLPDVSRSSSRSAARSRPTRPSAVLELAAAATRCASCMAPGRRSARDGAAGIPVEFVGGRRVTTPGGYRDRARVARRGQRGSLRRDRRARRAALRRRDRPRRPTPVPELGLVGDPLPPGRRRSSTALAAGRIPVVAPLAAAR